METFVLIKRLKSLFPDCYVNITGEAFIYSNEKHVNLTWSLMVIKNDKVLIHNHYESFEDVKKSITKLENDSLMEQALTIIKENQNGQN